MARGYPALTLRAFEVADRKWRSGLRDIRRKTLSRCVTVLGAPNSYPAKLLARIAVER